MMLVMMVLSDCLSVYICLCLSASAFSISIFFVVVMPVTSVAVFIYLHSQLLLIEGNYRETVVTSCWAQLFYC